MLFKKNLDLMYKVKGSGMMKAGKLCVSAIFRPVPSVVKSGQCKYLSLVPRPSRSFTRLLVTLGGICHFWLHNVPPNIKKPEKLCCSSVSSLYFGEKCCVTRKERLGGRLELTERFILLIKLISSLFF